MRALWTISWLGILGVLSAPAVARAQGEGETFAAVARLLRSHCAMPACHAGPAPAQGMPLIPGRIYRSTVNVRARTDPRFFRVVPGDPDHSLLYLKLLSPHQGAYRGPRMPLSMDPLSDDEIGLVRTWIASFPADLWGPPPVAGPERAATRTFQDAYLANLPTPDAIGARTLEFRIVHRFKAAATDAGSKGLYGLDSGAWISLDLSYGLTDAVDLGLRRTNLETDYEGYAKWIALRQAAGRSPFSVALRGSVSNVREADRFNRTRWAAQAIVGRRFGDRVSLMLVPTYVSRTNGLDAADHRGTGAVGAGAELRLGSHYALTGEWVVQTGGVEAPFQSASLGFSVATGRHVFHLLVTNTQGHDTDLYAPGGDLDARAGKFRLGFNISRTHTFAGAERSPPR